MSLLGRSVIDRADKSVWLVAGYTGEKYILEEVDGRELRLVPVDRIDALYLESEVVDDFTD